MRVHQCDESFGFAPAGYLLVHGLPGFFDDVILDTREASLGSLTWTVGLTYCDARDRHGSQARPHSGQTALELVSQMIARVDRQVLSASYVRGSRARLADLPFSLARARIAASSQQRGTPLARGPSLIGGGTSPVLTSS